MRQSLKTTVWGFPEIDCLIELKVSPLLRESSPSTTYSSVKTTNKKETANKSACNKQYSWPLNYGLPTSNSTEQEQQI